VVDRDGDGDLERGPGERPADRTELAPRGTATREVARFAQLTDLHVRDEESPARAPFLDRLGPPVTSTFRPQEALSPQVLAAAVRALDGERPGRGLPHRRPHRQRPGQRARPAPRHPRRPPRRPRHGGPGYRGVQQASNADGSFYRPAVDAPQVPDMLQRAQTPFASPGLRAPWYPAVGNHDVLVQGELAPSGATDAIATGDRLLMTFEDSLRDLVDRLPRGGATASPDLRDVPPEAIEAVLAGGLPPSAAAVPADPERRHLRNGELLARLRAAAGLRGGGDRLAYTADVGAQLRAIVLDTADRAGGAAGSLDIAQAAFLRRELARAGDRMVVVVSHHGLHRTGGPGAAAARAALEGSPDVVAELAGDTHRNEIVPVRTRSGGFWRITTSSLSDWPQQGRMLRVVTGPGGARAIETWMVDQAGGPGSRDLPGAARELAWIDAQGGRPAGFAGTRLDRNARLWLPPAR
jgi:hypothetical protein